jgi:hypothetical protein
MGIISKSYQKLKQWLILPKQQVLVLVLGSFMAFNVGTSGADVMIDQGAHYDYLYTDGGNDVAIYVPALNRNKYDYFDGGEGLDILWLRMHPKETTDPTFQADLIRYNYYVFHNVSMKSRTHTGKAFYFKSFHLQTRNIEGIIVEKVDDDRLLKYYKATPEQLPLPRNRIDPYDTLA